MDHYILNFTCLSFQRKFKRVRCRRYQAHILCARPSTKFNFVPWVEVWNLNFNYQVLIEHLKDRFPSSL